LDLSVLRDLELDLMQTEILMQHHDAVTGTHTQETGQDYKTRINEALKKADIVL
jgi:hypothetical protein